MQRLTLLTVWTVLTLLTLLTSTAVFSALAVAALSQPLAIGAAARLLVVAPHPDDEVLAAGGLIHQMHAAGGRVRVVYLTDGDGFREGVKLQEREANPSTKDFREYGKRRQGEARRALAALGLDEAAATFLSFPDQGLCKLTWTYWSDRRPPYRSPYTRRDRPPTSKAIVPDTEYRGEDLTLELATILGEFRPTLVLVPRQEDQHADHCAAWYFLGDALGDVRRVLPDFTTDVLTYIVHDDDWPGSSDSATLPPPPGVRPGPSGWIHVPLSPADIRAKRAALERYRTQQRAMGWFLESFVRRNEVFARPSPARIVLPLKTNCC